MFSSFFIWWLCSYMCYHVVYIIPADFLSSVEVFAETKFEVNAERRTYQWEDHGLSLHVSKGTTASFTIRAVWSSKFVVPVNVDLVSPVYWVSCEEEIEDLVEVEMQHYALLGDQSQRTKLRFIMCTLENAKPPYTFQVLEGHEQFSSVSSYGRQRVKLYNSLLAIVRIITPSQVPVPDPVFQARLYYQQEQQSTTVVHFVIVPKHEMSNEVKAIEKLFYLHTLLYTVFRCYSSVMGAVLSFFLVPVWRRWCSKRRLYHCGFRDSTVPLRAQ